MTLTNQQTIGLPGTPTPNIPLLRKGVEWAEEQEQLVGLRMWNQDFWFRTLDRKLAKQNMYDPLCETGMCIAGFVVTEMEFEISFDPASGIDEGGYYCASYAFDPATGITDQISNIATRELGITEEQSRILFDGINSAHDIRRISEEIAGEKL